MLRATAEALDDHRRADYVARGAMRRARSDAIVVVVVTLALLVAAIQLELSERIEALTQGLERWQFDEILLALFGLVLGLVWFSGRRLAESRAESAARRTAETRLSELLDQNRTLAQQAIRAQEEERRRIARELHDELGQCCVAIKIDAAAIERRLPADCESAAAGARAIVENAGAMHDIVRGMLHRLRQPALDELGLLACIQDLAETWEQRHGIACAFVPEGEFDDLDDAVKLVLYRIAQEGLTNIALHARADQATIRLQRDAAKRVIAIVEDNGRGSSAHASAREGLGLIGMSERVRDLGGELRLEQRPGGGFRVHVVVPAGPLPA